MIHYFITEEKNIGCLKKTSVSTNMYHPCSLVIPITWKRFV